MYHLLWEAKLTSFVSNMEEPTGSLLEKLVGSQQKTIEHLLDQNAKLVNLCVSMYMPVPVVQTGTPTPPTMDDDIDVALKGGLS